VNAVVFRTRVGCLLTALALAVGGPALGQSAKTQCDIVVQSQAGGTIEVVSAAQLAAAPRIVWRPTPSNGRLELLVAFQGATLAGLGEPSGVLVRFPLDADDLPDGVTLNIQSRNGRQWRFKGQGRDPGGDTGYVAFGQDLVYGRALLGAIADGQEISISVERYDRIVGSTAFNLENLRARDALLVQARRKFEGADPAMCTRR
jgi:hypothetical protein